jgi:hypothetical protein
VLGSASRGAANQPRAPPSPSLHRLEQLVQPRLGARVLDLGPGDAFRGLGGFLVLRPSSSSPSSAPSPSPSPSPPPPPPPPSEVVPLQASAAGGPVVLLRIRVAELAEAVIAAARHEHNRVGVGGGGSSSFPSHAKSLATVPELRSVDHRELRVVAAASRDVELPLEPAGMPRDSWVLLRQGVRARSLYFVLNGKVLLPPDAATDAQLIRAAASASSAGSQQAGPQSLSDGPTTLGVECLEHDGTRDASVILARSGVRGRASRLLATRSAAGACFSLRRLIHAWLCWPPRSER